MTDHARPLNKRGCRDAPTIGGRLAQMGWQPQLVLSSDSQRTRETYNLMQDTWECDVQVEFLPALYHAGKAELAMELARVPRNVSTVLALGHNPGWEEVIEWLCGQHVRMTTANAALLQGTGATWPDAVSGAATWTLHEVLRPNEL